MTAKSLTQQIKLAWSWKLALLPFILIMQRDSDAQVYTIENGPPIGYVLREQQRFFAIGAPINGLNPKVVDEAAFTSLKEMFNALWLQIRDIDSRSHLYPDGIFTSLDYVHHDEGVFLAGDLPYRLKTFRGAIIDTNQDGIFQPSEQRSAPARVTREGARGVMQTIYQLVNPPGGPRRNMIYFLMDEPDTGNATERDWAFSETLLQRFYEHRKEGVLTYIDLGPVSGSKWLYERQFPFQASDRGDANPFARLRFSHPDYESNVRRTTAAYAAATDIIGLNSYDATNRRPVLLGEAVTWMQESSGQKPIWPWVSGEPFRYASVHDMYQRIRPQVFAAIIHGASGIFFYNDQGAIARCDSSTLFLDRMFDLVKEVNLFKSVIEDFSATESKYTSGQHYRLFKQKTKNSRADFYVLMNPGAQSQVVKIGSFNSFVLSGLDAGVWFARDDRTLVRLSPLDNLSFEVPTNKAFPATVAQWNIRIANKCSVSRQKQKAKLGLHSVLMKDESSKADEGCWIEQKANCAPGQMYEAQAWHLAVTGKAQNIALLFYDEAGKLLLEKETAAPLTTAAWSLVKTRAEAPAGAAKVALRLHSGAGTSTGFWDDVLLKMTAK